MRSRSPLNSQRISRLVMESMNRMVSYNQYQLYDVRANVQTLHLKR